MNAKCKEQNIKQNDFNLNNCSTRTSFSVTKQYVDQNDRGADFIHSLKIN